jgi:hypothetical protein
MPWEAGVGDGYGPLGGEASGLGAWRHNGVEKQGASVAADPVVEGDVAELLRDDDCVVVDGQVGAVVDLIASVVKRSELAIVGEEVRMRQRNSTPAGVVFVLDLVWAVDAGKPSLSGGVLGTASWLVTATR